MQHSTRWAAALCAAATLGTIAATPAAAQETRFAGYTNGCFGDVGLGTACPVGPATADVFENIAVGNGVLRFLNSTFDQTTANGFLALGGSPQTAARNVNNLGSFVIDAAAAPVAPDDPEELTNTRFTLRVTFSDPLGITTGQSTTYDASISGAVRRASATGPAAGGYFIDFDNNDPIVLTYAGGRSFSIAVADVSVNPTAGAASITANIQAVVPEPGSIALVATGLLLLGAAGRRRAPG